MQERLHTRLEALRKEWEIGQAELDKVEQRRTYLRDTLLRITGAMQVLEELLGEAQASGHDGAGCGELSSMTTEAR